MNQTERLAKALRAADHCLKSKGYIAMADVFMEMGVLEKRQYEDWRFRRVPYLERVIKLNLHQITAVVKAVRANSLNGKLKPSWTAYMSWGKGRKEVLRFSKTGNPHIEETYATHYVMPRTKPPQSAEMLTENVKSPSPSADANTPASEGETIRV